MLREQIIKDITQINNLQLLNQIFEYIQVMKNTEKTLNANKDADEIKTIIDREF